MAEDAGNDRDGSVEPLASLAVVNDPAAAVIAICAAITVVCVFFAYIG